MAAISTSRCEFTQFVTDHFVGNKYWNVLTTIMDSDGQTDHVRKIVERRDQVRRGFLSPLSTAFSTFFSKCRSIKGPFLRERGMAYPLKLFATATYDEFISTLVAAGLLTFGLQAPRGYRVLTKVTTFTTTMWVVYWSSSQYRER